MSRRAPSQLPLSGQTALVTGASAGIGRASAVALAQAGAKVVATWPRKAELDALAKECGKNAVEAVAGDINDAGFVAHLAPSARAVDLLLTHAGLLQYAPLMDM